MCIKQRPGPANTGPTVGLIYVFSCPHVEILAPQISIDTDRGIKHILIRVKFHPTFVHKSKGGVGVGELGQGSRHPPSIFQDMGLEMVILCRTHPGLQLDPS